ncbi:MAG: RDD family protein [Alphaproteobacteria bacterium]|nr:RDD family protein [Alphaproteobacteria bacterium]
MTSLLPDPETAPELFEGVLTRRVIAFCIDFLILSLVIAAASLVGVIVGVFTLGLGFLAMPVILLLAVVSYYGATLGSYRRATVGMQMMDLILTPTRDVPLDGWRAFAHPLIFWVTCWVLAPLLLLVALFTPRRQLLHDLVLGTLMVRRSPMERHWNHYLAA